MHAHDLEEKAFLCRQWLGMIFVRVSDIGKTDGRIFACSALGFGFLREEGAGGEEKLEGSVVDDCYGEVVSACYGPAVSGFKCVDVCCEVS